MRLRHIEVFHAIYTSGSITNAASLLCVSQPSVSKVLSHAESQLGFSLFQRNKGKLVATNEAHMLFKEVDVIYKQLFSIKKLSKNIKKSEHGLVNIAVTPALGLDVIPKAIAAFRHVHPNVHFKVQTLHNDDAASALIEHRCDLAILYNSPVLPHIQEIELGSSEMVVVYPKKLFPECPASIEIDKLFEHELINIWESGPLGELVFSRINNTEKEVNSSIQIDTYYVASGLVKEGLGCCTIDRLTAEANTSDATGIAAFNPPLDFKIKALYMETRPLPKICEDFIPFLKKQIEQVID